ncbi:hypothetical protein HDU85_007110 [Gaertneriomyces sp. JEL0708]|nr:hypothetical protein HDU85_007110 [Gaertneriomyces sp. JEL0708]
MSKPKLVLQTLPGVDTLLQALKDQHPPGSFLPPQYGDFTTHSWKAPDMADGSSDTFVTFGTPQPADVSLVKAKERNKYLPVHLQEPRDEQGRKRFHGAFTGGFSAGYFNTVGSKEGWTPSNFVSSRSSRSTYRAARPEDFMDEDDLGDVNNSVRPTEEFDILGGTERELARKQVAAKAISEDTAAIGGLQGKLVEDLIGPARDSVGIKLLRQMGWREGHGVGPRAKRKRKHDDDYDIHAEQYTFAPKDTVATVLKPKTNTYGLGYDPFRNAHEFAAAKGSGSASSTSTPGKPKGGIGVGVFEDEDEDLDVYASTTSKYDTIIHDDEEDFSTRFKKLRRSEQQLEHLSRSSQDVLHNLCNDGRPPLPGFVLAKVGLPETKFYTCPPVPADFVPEHHFDRPVPTALATLGAGGRQVHLTADQRRDILEEEALKAPARSIFSYLSLKEQDRLHDFVQRANKSKKVPDEPKPSPEAPPVDVDTALAALKGFMPFGNEPAKQRRYQAFLEAKAGLGAAPAFPKGLSTQEAAHELLEFSKAAQIFKPLSTMMASRFTSASQQPHEEKLEKQEAKVAVDAAQLNMYGRLTRSRVEWRPDKLLCKRFNLADPYESKKKRKGDADEEERFQAKPRPQDERRKEKEVLNQRTMDELMFERDRLVAQRTDKNHAPNEATPPILDGSDPVGAAGGSLPSESAGADPVVEKYERPPMDIFKAIFADSDDESSDSEREEDATPVPPAATQISAPTSTTPGALRPVFRKKDDRGNALPIPETSAAMVEKLPPPTFRPIFRKKEERRKEMLSNDPSASIRKPGLAHTAGVTPPHQRHDEAEVPVVELVSHHVPEASQNVAEDDPSKRQDERRVASSDDSDSENRSRRKSSGDRHRRKEKKGKKERKRKKRRRSDDHEDDRKHKRGSRRDDGSSDSEVEVWLEKPAIIADVQRSRTSSSPPARTRVRPSAADFM